MALDSLSHARALLYPGVEDHDCYALTTLRAGIIIGSGSADALGTQHDVELVRCRTRDLHRVGRVELGDGDLPQVPAARGDRATNLARASSLRTELVVGDACRLAH